MSKIIVTGGAGFIGSQLGKSLVDQGHEVVLLDNMSFGHLDNLIVDGKPFGKFLGLDVRSPELAKHFKGVDTVFHFAGIAPLPVCQEQPYYATDVNVGGTANVLEAARVNGVRRVVFASTSAVYESNTKYPNSESDDIDPKLIYAVTKWQCEKLCHSYRDLYGMEIAITRYFNVYGPHQDFLRTSPPLMGYVIREFLAKRAPMLHSDGLQERDYAYVDDVNRLNMLCMTHPKAAGQTFNVGSGVSTSVRKIIELLGKGVRSVQPDLPEPTYRSAEHFWDAYPKLWEGTYPLKKSFLEKEVKKYSLADISKAKELLGWEPQVSIEQGIAETVKYALKLAGR